MKRYGTWTMALASAGGYLALLSTARTDSVVLLGVWAGLFVLYALLVYYQSAASFPLLLGAALVFRLIGLWGMPTLSDDVYRFIWDGRLLAQGYNPYLYLPAELLSTNVATEAGLTEALFQKLNSPGYYTIYPPVLQGWFGLSTLLGSTEAGVAFWLRLPLLLGEVVSVWLLYQLTKDAGKNQAQRSVLFYALNPLIIVELTGNIHYEGLTICFLLACLYFFKKQKNQLSAIFLGLSVGVKLLPLIFLPALLDRTRLRKSLVYALVTGLVTLVPFLFFFDSVVLSRFLTSLDLYFRKFEFNASLYYLLRWAGTQLVGYNPIGILGPLLSLLSFSAILYLSFSRRFAFTLPERLLLILTVYLFCATTVHPWYVTPLIALGVLGRFRYPIVWSALLPFTYLAYGQVPFQENLWIVALEYLIVGRWLWWEVEEYAQKKNPEPGR
jgi:alpha-1,6-mannosyltransferase